MKNLRIATIVVLFSAALSAPPLQAQSATGYAGYFSSANGIGVYGYSSGSQSVENPLAPGLQGESSRGVGVYGRGDISDSSANNNEGGYFVGGKGLYARGTDLPAQTGYGARIFSSNFRGMYAEGSSGYFDAYFGGTSGISTNGIVDRSPGAKTLVVNIGSSAIEPGDLVAMAGTASSPEDGQPMLAVAKLDAGNQNAVIGVAKQAVLGQTVVSKDGSQHYDFQLASGRVEPEGYLVIITSGLAPAVKLGGLAKLAGAKIGDRVALAGAVDGEVALALTKELGRSPYQAPALAIGKVAGAIDEINATIPIYIKID